MGLKVPDFPAAALQLGSNRDRSLRTRSFFVRNAAVSGANHISFEVTPSGASRIPQIWHSEYESGGQRKIIER